MNIKSLIRLLLRKGPMFEPQRCYGQDGEDLILDRILEYQTNGFYVDVGAHHPIRFSNTYLFYQRGWHGVNIDAMPGSMKKFNQLRPRDINVECGVARQAGVLSYHRFNEPALNTFDSNEAALKDILPYKRLDTVDVPVERLDVLLKRHVKKEQCIDFMSIDVEGKDLEVLESNDWNLFRPRLVLAETLRVDIMNLGDCPIVRFLINMGYKPIAKAYNTTFFARIDIF